MLIYQLIMTFLPIGSFTAQHAYTTDRGGLLFISPELTITTRKNKQSHGLVYAFMDDYSISTSPNQHSTAQLWHGDNILPCFTFQSTQQLHLSITLHTSNSATHKTDCIACIWQCSHMLLDHIFQSHLQYIIVNFLRNALTIEMDQQWWCPTPNKALEHVYFTTCTGLLAPMHVGSWP